MLNIPLALIGAIWGHLIMGLDFTLPSMIGFVKLASSDTLNLLKAS